MINKYLFKLVDAEIGEKLVDDFNNTFIFHHPFINQTEYTDYVGRLEPETYKFET